MELLRTNEKRTTLCEFKDVNLQVNYFWDTKQELVNWNEFSDAPTSWSHVKVRIDLYSFTHTFEGLGKTVDFQVCQLFVNNECIGGEVLEVVNKVDDFGTLTVVCSLIVGHG